MVGCVIVREGQIVGEGFHQYEWLDHAEIIALKSAVKRARGAALYVTLEPCNPHRSHRPCTEAIIAGAFNASSRRWAIESRHSGPGFERSVRRASRFFHGACEEEARRSMRRFCMLDPNERSHLLPLKSAMTLDGQLALPAPMKRRQEFPENAAIG